MGAADDVDGKRRGEEVGERVALSRMEEVIADVEGRGDEVVVDPEEVIVGTADDVDGKRRGDEVGERVALLRMEEVIADVEGQGDKVIVDVKDGHIVKEPEVVVVHVGRRHSPS